MKKLRQVYQLMLKTIIISNQVIKAKNLIQKEKAQFICLHLTIAIILWQTWPKKAFRWQMIKECNPIQSFRIKYKI